MNQQKNESLSWNQRLILMGLFLTPVLIVAGAIWGISAVINTPEYKNLYPKQGILIYKKEAGGGKLNPYYYFKVNIDGKQFAFSLKRQFRSAYRKLQPGDQMDMLVKREHNVTTRQQRIYELKVNGEMLVTYNKVVSPSNYDLFSKKICIALLGILVFFILIKFLFGPEEKNGDLGLEFDAQHSVIRTTKTITPSSIKRLIKITPINNQE